MVKKRRRHTAAFMSRVALEALEGSKTINQILIRHDYRTPAEEHFVL